ncbi:MAG: biotin synthase BioB [Gammaproteobacteria bacterium]|nr:biotin synthase BioB [Gammaproteobacteria bacterium]MBU0785746.1 biotin synthase BioB [Gammaproteobacteria bacterium]MBU0813742.1 biotin synthase BioB [Gammaproteobacteria bacterium]MBU1788786.1 biotin synthase BioB [Gammaproteobacteria bacterium]
MSAVLEQAIVLHRSSPRSSKPAADVAWTVDAIQALFELPFPELLFRAQTVHREHFNPSQIEFATLLSVKTGGCPEDCGYCPQSASFDTGVKASKLMELEEVLFAARRAKDAGATRFCMGAAWREPKDRDIEKVAELVNAVKGLGMETCATLGMLGEGHAETLRDAGLDYYNHNLDTSPDFYGDIISTRVYQDRLDTLARVRSAGVKVCSGGIVGMGESHRQRAGLIAELANLSPYPESVPINNLVRVEGTPLAEQAPLDPFEFVRTIAVARITMPKARVRLSAGRQQMGDAVQALCFLAGANSIFYGDKLLTTGNPDTQADVDLLHRLGMRSGAPEVC